MSDNDTIIFEFLAKQTCASICTVDERGFPYCFSCFYAFDINNVLLYFKSSPDSRHSQLLLKNSLVAGTVLPNKLNKIRVKGIQFEGRALTDLSSDARHLYYRKFPFAKMVAGDIWAIQLDKIKLTDSSLVFGKKMNWKRIMENKSI